MRCLMVKGFDEDRSELDVSADPSLMTPLKR
jgi:hypothetical protein